MAQQSKDYRFGVLASLIANFAAGKGKSFGPADFFASLKEESKEESKRPQTPQDMLREIMAGYQALKNPRAVREVQKALREMGEA